MESPADGAVTITRQSALLTTYLVTSRTKFSSGPPRPPRRAPPGSLALDVNPAGSGGQEQHPEQQARRRDAAVAIGHLDDQGHADRGHQRDSTKVAIRC